MADTKDRILDAAEKMFANLGVDGASLRAITDAAGVNLGSIHYYFKTKDQLVEEVLVRRIDQYNREGVAQLAAMKKYHLRSSVRDIWLVVIGSMLEFRRRHPDYLKFLQHLLVTKEQMLYGTFLEKYYDEVDDTLLELLSTRFLPKKRKQANIRCRVLIEMLSQAMLHFNMVQFCLIRSDIHLTDDQIAEQLADIAVSALSEFMES